MTSLAALALAAALQGQSPQSAFTTEEAARCGVVFAHMAEVLSDMPDAPEALVGQVAVGLPIWEYELIASAPGQEEVLNQAVEQAIATLGAGMPQGDEAASARGDYLIGQAQSCGRMIDAAYPDGRHPVIAEMRRAQAQSANQSQSQGGAAGAGVPIPSQKPAQDGGSRRLR